MGTKVGTLAQAAGVDCPKVSGKVKLLIPCNECEHHQKCLSQLNKFMGWPGDD